MPGFELIGKEELFEVQTVFKESGILFRHSFDNLRNGIYKVKDFENSFSAYMKTPFSLAVTSGTAALRVALASLNVKNGDEIITQSFTFVATAEAIIESNATPVFTEIDDTLNMDPDDLENKISSKTKAVIVVHMLGTPARLRKIKLICDKYDIPIIEDTAWGCGGLYEDIPLGTYGKIGTYSFDFAKTMTTGEGGMIVFNDEDLYKKAAAWHDHGHENNPKLPRWEDSRSSSGFNYRMMELQGAIGLAQLKKLNYVIKKQRANSNAIKLEIADLPITFRSIPKKSFETSDALIFFVKNNQVARDCRSALLKNGIGTKILPEAISWHFAGTWDHMDPIKKLKKNQSEVLFKKSLFYLDRSVSIPITVYMDDNIPKKIKKALSSVFS